MTDEDLALATLGRVAPSIERAVAVVHPGDPIPKMRARVLKTGGHYTPKRSADAERDLTWLFKTLPGRPYVTNVAIVAIFYLADRRPKDFDNLLKLVMDAGTRAHVWHDDSQVTACAVLVELDRRQPRTVIAICQTTSTLDRTVPAKRRDRGLLDAVR